MLVKIDRQLIVTVLLMTSLIFLIWLASLFMVKGPQKIGATYMTLNNSFYQAINEELTKATDLKGDILYTRDPALDVDKQYQQIEEFIEKKVSVIVINPVDGENKKIQARLLENAQGSSVLQSVMTGPKTQALLAQGIKDDNALTAKNYAEIMENATATPKFRNYSNVMEKADHLVERALNEGDIDAQLSDIQEQLQVELEK